ncbi:hypothetical protein NNJEOMEG_00019 [Fundidesulfovibrio magnetotacticus]|uniref:4Fe-4S ferredoxin-type domain-containing protein n=1 Tax=Fundidesulfovibrio magnetotacticus TaxID=2730080 RepID=A0A6V8LPF5_9BACT|nr:4Fe-4S dicluster domain-containing protein [Fundidesulfovibrio magnetotacticus]GFK92198.1 hypothetical protein NNJEOMEG_00019 [Fundidesulfovibrio magnetotacticus]
MQELDALKQRIVEALPGLDCVIGWEPGPSPLTAAPLFMRTPADVDRLVWGPFNAPNTAVYLPAFKGRKVGVVVKGCDSRSVVELIQEKLVRREELVVFAMPCRGVADASKVAGRVGDLGQVSAAARDGATLQVTTPEGMAAMPWDEACADKCLNCQYPNALVSDHFLGDPLAPAQGRDAAADEMGRFEAMAPAERMAWWAQAMDRCIRCYACRNACPMCVCRDHCIAQTRDPHWVSQEDGVREKLMFQAIHALHLAGRCTECGECQRACPVDIPILALRRKLNRVVKDVFDYQAGVDPQAVPPLFTFQVEEAKINERGW